MQQQSERLARPTGKMTDCRREAAEIKQTKTTTTKRPGLIVWRTAKTEAAQCCWRNGMEKVAEG